ncbi:ribonuclease J [Patescibacteria group bacterium]
MTPRTKTRKPKTRQRHKTSHYTSHGKLKIIPLGGTEEVGRNMTIFEYGSDIVIVDMGFQFPEENMPGIDYIIPNIEYLKGKEKNIRGVIITHGHMDHIGAIPYIIPRLGNPTIYTAKLTKAIVEKRQEEFSDRIKTQEVKPGENLKLGSFNISFFGVNHNIPDSLSVILKTPVGTFVHTGDWKFDYSPVGDKPADLGKIALLGEEGVTGLLCDSTDADTKGYSISEKRINATLAQVFEKAPGRIVAATFASNLNRIKQLILLGEKYGRRTTIDGRSMKTNVEIAHKQGFLKVKPGTIVDLDQARRLPKEKVLIIVTGAQGENRAALMRMANGEHRQIHIRKGDTVLFSSSVVPGNERSVQYLKDTLVREGARVIHYRMMDVHAGGHARQEDIKLMIRLLKPKYFVPIEGNTYLLVKNAEVAQSVGIPPNNTIIPSNGQIIEFDSQGKGKLTPKKVPASYVMVDGLGVGDVSHVVLRDRQQLAEDGMFVIVLNIDNRGKLVSSPDIISRGFVYVNESQELLAEARKKVKKILDRHKDKRARANYAYIKDQIRDDIGQFLYNKTERRPMVLPVIIQV